MPALLSEPALDGARRCVTEWRVEAGGEWLRRRCLLVCWGLSESESEQGRETRGEREPSAAVVRPGVEVAVGTATNVTGPGSPSRVSSTLAWRLIAPSVHVLQEDVCRPIPGRQVAGALCSVSTSKQSGGAQGVTTPEDEGLGVAFAGGLLDSAAFCSFAKTMNAATVSSDVSSSSLGRASGVCERRSRGGFDFGAEMGSGLLAG